MIKHNNKQIGFIYKGDKLINKIIHNNKTYYEKGFLRETIGASPLTIRGVGLPFKNYEIFGNTTQETTTGKNIYNYSKKLVSSTSGLKTTILEDGTFEVTGKPSNNYVKVSTFLDITDLLEDGQKYTILSTADDKKNLYLQVTCTKSDGSGDTYISTQNGVTSFVVNKTNYNMYRAMIQTSTTTSWGSETKTIQSKFMIYKGSGNNTFEPYTGAQPSPNPDYPQEIESVGDLVTDTTDANYGKYKIPVNVQSENACFNILSKETKTGFATTLAIEYIERKLKPDTYYTIIGKCTINSKFYIDRTNNTISSGRVNVDVGDDGILFYNIKTPSDLSSLEPIASLSFEGKTVLQILKVYRDGNDELPNYSDLMIVEGNYTRETIPPYQPYFNQTTNIYLSAPLRKIGDYADYVDFKDGKVVRNIGEDIFDGINKLATNFSNKNTMITFDCYVEKRLSSQEYWVKCNNSICNRFLPTTLGALASTSPNVKHLNCFATWVIYARFSLPTTYTNIDEVNNYLKTNNIILNSILETPTEETITLPSILTTNGTNNITIDTKTSPSNIYLKYKSEV